MNLVHSTLEMWRLWSGFYWNVDLTYIQYKIPALLCESHLLSCMLCKTKEDWNLLSFSLPTCGRWCGAKVRTTEKELRIIIFPQYVWFQRLRSMLVSLDRSLFPPPLFFCSTSVKSCPRLLSARSVQPLVVRSQSNALPHFPVGTRMGEDVNKWERERHRKEG